jgi:hypothetical protein
MVEKWDSSKIGGKRGGSKGKPWTGGQGLHDRKGGHMHPTHRLSLKTRRAQTRTRLRACRLPRRRLFSRDLRWRSKSVAADKGGKR